jgi:hypothetical protein
LNSIKNLEETIEAAKAMLSEEKTPVSKERAEDIPIEFENLIKTGNTLTSSKQGLKPKTVDATKHTGALKHSKGPYYFFAAAFCIWVILLLTIYLPISGLKMTIFPFINDNTEMMYFLVSATVASIFSLSIGIKKLREKE